MENTLRQPTSDATVLLKSLSESGDQDKSIAMSKYMRNLFPFWGIPTPKRREIHQRHRQTWHLPGEPWETFFDQCWASPYREAQYVALDELSFRMRTLPEESLLFLMDHVPVKSWWDTVDPMAMLAGRLISRFPKWQYLPDAWIAHDNFWIRRVAILYQLGYKEKTNEQRLFEYCLSQAAEKEFFIQKAIGWALRTYARIAPERVADFVNNHSLAALSRREALKHINPK